MANNSERTIRACPGTQCKRGLQDSVAVEVMLDEKHDKRAASGEVKLGVSGCPHRCAESSFKDIGLVGTDTGWEIYLQNNCETNAQIAEPLAKNLSTEKALDLIDCLLAYYRENAEQGEKIGCTVRRLGHEHVRRSLGI